MPAISSARDLVREAMAAPPVAPGGRRRFGAVRAGGAGARRRRWTQLALTQNSKSGYESCVRIQTEIVLRPCVSL